MATLGEVPESAAAKRSVSDHDLIQAASKYIVSGSLDATSEVLAAAQEEVARRLAEARAAGATEREVVLSVLQPIFSSTGHCRCAACRQRCLVCRFWDY